MFALMLKNNDRTIADVYLSNAVASSAAYWTSNFSGAESFPTIEEAQQCAKDVIHAEIGDHYGSSTMHTSLLHVGLELSAERPVSAGVLHLVRVKLERVEEYAVEGEITAPADFVEPSYDGDGKVRGKLVHARCSITDGVTEKTLVDDKGFTAVVSNSIQDRASMVMACRAQFKKQFETRMKTEPDLALAMKGKSLRFHANILALPANAA